MKLNLDILASTSIKRKKPWPRVLWIGDEYESLLLLDEDSHRISILYVPSGKTKRKINKLSPFVQETVHINSTKNGHFLLGLQQTGDLFVWYKDKDVTKTIQGLAGIVLSQELINGQAQIYASDDLSHIVVTVKNDQIYIWQRKGIDSAFSYSSPEIPGMWHRVTVPKDIDLPRFEDCREFTSDVIFFAHQTLGRCCQYSMMFNNSIDVCVVTLLLRFNNISQVQSKTLPSFHVEWNVIQYPFKKIHPKFSPIHSRGSLMATYARTGQVVAVAANQNRASYSSVLFVAPLTDTVLVSNLKGCGVRDMRSKRGRNYWVSDMAWTSDDLLLACMMKSGLVCLITRLGEPQVIQTITNRGVEMGPSMFLPLHPLQIISADNDGHIYDKDGRSVSPSSITSVQDSQRQRFSVTTHPSLPIILFSDGFMVTVAQLRADLSNLTLMRELVMASARHLKDIKEVNNLDLAVFDAYSLPSQRDSKHNKAYAGKQKKSFRFEEPDNLNNTVDSETSFLEQDRYGMDMMKGGKILFAECDSPLVDPESFTGLSGLKLLSKHFQLAESYLMTIWRLAVSYTDPWSTEAENITKQTVNNLIKLFAVMLECPGIEDVLSQDRNLTSAPQNPRLFIVIQTYKKAFELLRFDIINQNLMPIALKFVNDSLTLILNSQMLQITDPRIKTLSGCYALLKVSESLINRVYIWVPKDSPYTGLPPESPGHQKHAYEPAILMRAQMSPRTAAREIIYADPRTLGLDQQAQLPGRRLSGSWKLLYKGLVHYQSQIQRSGQEKELEQINNLLFAVEQTIRQIDGDVPQITSPKISKGERYSLDGMHTMAVDAWQKQLKVIADQSNNSEKVVKVLHSMLYTYIMKGELGKAVDFVDSLVVQVNAKNALMDQLPQCQPGLEKPLLMTIMSHTLKSQGSTEPHYVPCIKDRPVRQLVQSMARFMAAYFTNETMYIFPPHNAQPLLSIHMGAVVLNSRIIPQYHGDINRHVAQNGLSKTWSTERTLEYLLLSGLVCEAAWFADKMGDWKAGFLLSVGCTEHKQRIVPKLYKKKRKPLQMLESLLPEAILKQKLEALIHLDKRITNSPREDLKDKKEECIPIDDGTNIVQLTRTLQDILMAGIISNVEIVPWLMSMLVEQLKQIVSKLSPLVPQDFYLPAPPMYCPQPADTSEDQRPADVEREKKLRFQASSLIQLLLVVMNATNMSLPAIRWYVKELSKIQERAAQFKSTTEGPCMELPEILQDLCSTRSLLRELQTNPAVEETLKSVRDFYTLLWLLHCRDKLSFNLRKRESYLNDMGYQDYVRDSWESKDGEQWTKECFTTLQWAIHMLTFSRFLPDEGCIYKVILSLLQELPSTEDTADILAEHFYDPENLDVEVQEKLEKFLDNWKSVFIEPEDDGKSAKPEQQEAEDDENDGRKSVTFFEASPRGKTLSVYFTKQCEVVMKVLKKKSKIYGVYEEFIFDETGKVPCGTLTSTLPLDKSVFSIGSRPFETKLSYLEFLDTFTAIAYTKLLDSESKGSHMPYPLLLAFANDICQEQFHELDSKVKRPEQNSSLMILASPRSKHFVGSSEKHSEDSKANQQKSKGLFHSQSTGQERTDQSPQRGKVNMTNLASKFSQSEEVLYKNQISEDEQGWSLDVNFGKKYDKLRHMLEWLAVWSHKQHSLGLHWKGEKDLAFKPAMRIEVQPQLVLLSLWLVEHKYCPISKPKPESSSLTNGSSLESHASKHMQIQDIAEQMNKQVLEAVRQRTSGKYPRRKKDMNQSSSFQSESGPQSLESSQRQLEEDTNQIQSAYEDVLNGNDSSSLEVSSLEPEEYSEELQTLAHGSRSGSMRDSRRSHRQRNQNVSTLEKIYYRSPERETYTSPERRSSRSPGTSTPVIQHSSRRRERHVDEENFTAKTAVNAESGRGMGNDLAQQLQQIVRGELRRMMEAQHRSMMAMMGAFDDTMVLQGQSPSYSNPRGQDHSPNKQSERGTRSTMVVEELHATGDMRRRSSPGRHADQRSSSPKRLTNTREALTEMRDLQRNTSAPRRKSRSPSQGRSRGMPLNMSELHSANEENVQYNQIETQQGPPPGDQFSRYLRVTHADRDTEDVPRLPPIPLPAWAEDTRPRDVTQYGIPHMPLLHLERGPSPQALSRVPMGHSPHLYQQKPLMSRGESYPLPNFPQPVQPPSVLLYQQNSIPSHIRSQGSQQNKAVEGESKLIEMPLLKIMPEEKPFLGEPTFGRLLDPSLLLNEEQRLEQHNLQRQKPIQDFFTKQAELLEAQRGQDIGSHLLRVDLNSQQLPQQKEMSRSRSLRRKQRKSQKSGETLTESEAEKVKTASVKVSSSEKEPSDSVPPTASEEEERSEEATEEGEEEGKIYDGYAIQPGSFEHYLEMDEKDFEADTNARVQYKTAMLIKQQRAREKRKKVDFSTMTKNYEDAGIETGASLELEQRRTAEAATSITKDTGVDPVQEAILQYNRARQGAALPPDIYLGLRFNDGQPTSDVIENVREKPKGRSYINVVDVDAEAVLNDLSRKPDKEVQQDLGFKSQSVTMTSVNERDLTHAEESMREVLRPRGELIPPPSADVSKQDSVTVKMFESKGLADNRVSVAVLPRDSVQGSRGAILERLRDMGRQMEAIDHLSSNMERGFHNTRLMLGTLDTLTGADEGKPAVDGAEDVSKVKPKTKKALTPKKSSKTPDVSARTTARTQKTSSMESKERSVDFVKMSGLSGISDIIGEMVEKGDIDLEEAGFSQQEALNLAHKIKTSARSAHTEEEQERIRRSIEYLEKMSQMSDTKEEEMAKEEQRAALHAWMMEKRSERMREYKQKRAELREHERRPYIPDQDTKFKVTSTTDKERKIQGHVHMKQRMQEAQHLLVDIMSEKPELPPEVPIRERSPKRKKSPPRDHSPKYQTQIISQRVRDRSPVYSTRDRSPKQQTRTINYRERDYSPKRQTVTISPEVKRKEYESHVPVVQNNRHQNLSQTPAKRDRSAPKEVAPPVIPRLKLMDSDEFMQNTGETTGEIKAYQKIVEEIEDSQEFTPHPKQTESKSVSVKQPDVPSSKVYKEKSFKDMVRLQRPEITRKKAGSRIPISDAMMREIQNEMDTDRTSRETNRELSPEEKYRLYGSKHLPGEMTRYSPRPIKTYAERLQDMKSKQKYTTPIVPRSGPASVTSARTSHEMMRRKPTGPARKPMTYVQQLQRLNAGTHKKRGTAPAMRTVKMQTFMRSHKPVHKPQTYVEQLRGLQPPPSVHKRVSPSRKRPRPYADPYRTEGETWDRDSVLSDWSVDDNVKRLLYEDDSTVYKTSYGGMSMDYTETEGGSDYYDYVMGDEYLGSVDINEIAQIADAASVHSGSIMSVIDWDAVDDLIADV